MNDFFNLVRQAVDNYRTNKMQTTENGALGYSTTSSKILDMHFKLSSYRNKVAEIVPDFMQAYNENPALAMKYLFYARDILEGLGERNFFRTIVKYLAKNNKFPADFIQYIPEYGRYDDLFVLMGTPLEKEVFYFVNTQLLKDMEAVRAGKNPSLLAKWMPSINTSSKKTVSLAKKLVKALGLSEKQYRIMLTVLRSKLNIVEQKMSAGEWDKIDYETVASKANAIYRNAFMEHDGNRRTIYLGKLSAGQAKINAKTLLPYEIVHNYCSSYRGPQKYDATLENLWKSLPYVGIDSNTIVVADGSGSMCSRVGKSNVTALEVANSLAIYFAEKLKGAYNNKYITFSEHPQFVDMSRCNSLKDKITMALKHCEIADTNIEAVFNLILNTAINYEIKPKDMMDNILIISDMEFNEACYRRVDKSLFESIAERYARNGYKLPRLIFWNVNSRTNTIPVTYNESGVTLVSGFSPNVFNMVLNNELDPYKALVKTLMSERYNKIKI